MDDHIVDANKKVDRIIKAAREAGWTDMQLSMAAPAEIERLSRFYAIAFKAGMERAAEIAMQIDMEAHGVLPIRAAMIAKHIQYAIRAHAQNQPKPIHDSSVV